MDELTELRLDNERLRREVLEIELMRAKGVRSKIGSTNQSSMNLGRDASHIEFGTRFRKKHGLPSEHRSYEEIMEALCMGEYRYKKNL